MTSYTFKDIEKIFKGSDELHKMEKDISRFYKIIKGIILSKDLKQDYQEDIEFISYEDVIDKQLSVHIHKPFSNKDLWIEIKFLTKKYYFNSSLPKNAIPIIWKNIPKVLSILIKNNPWIKKDIKFLISLSSKIKERDT